MRLVITTTDESHPNVPPPMEFTGEGLIWQIYVDGEPFLGIPLSEKLAHDNAQEQVSKIIAMRRNEYVDLRLRPERREEDRRVHGTFTLQLRRKAERRLT